MLERTDVAALAADDPPLHVVRRQLHDRDGRLGRVARRDALQRVCDEIARAPLRFRFCLLLERADASRELVADELLAAIEQMCLRLLQREAGNALELRLLRELCLLQFLLELAQMR